MPPPLSDEDLSLALDGTASPSVLDHLAQCAGCAARLAEATQFESVLKSRLFRLDCPEASELGDYQVGLVSDERIQAIQAHLERCPHCRAELDEIENFLREETAAPSVRPKASRPPEVPRRRNWLQGLATVLPPMPQPVLRGGTSNERIIRAQTEDGTMVRLAASAEDDVVVVQGQIIGDPAIWVGALVEVRHAERLLVITTVLESGQFRFEIASASPISMKITAESGPTLLVENIVLTDVP